MPTQVDDELEQYAKKPSASGDELEQYAKKAEPSELESTVEKENLTPRMRAAVTSGVAKMAPPTRFETEHTPSPEDTGWMGRLKQGAGDIGHMVAGLGDTLAGPIVTPGRIADIAAGFSSRAVPNKGQEGLSGARSMPYNVLATGAGALGVDPTGMEASGEHGDPWGVVTHAAAQATPVLAAEVARSPVGRGIADIGGKAVDAIHNPFREDPNVAAQRALRPGPKKAIKAQADLAGARPYLEGAEDLADLQNKVKTGKGEVWKPYKEVIDGPTGDKEIEGPDGPTTVRNLEEKRLELSAQRSKLRSMLPTDRASALQKDADLRANEEHYHAVTGALDPELKAAGIDPVLIRNTHGNLTGVQKLIEGRNTLTETDRAYGLGRMAEDFHVTKPARSIVKGVIPGIGDIMAGRPWWSGKPTDVNVGEGFRAGTGGEKPALTLPAQAGGIPNIGGGSRGGAPQGAALPFPGPLPETSTPLAAAPPVEAAPEPVAAPKGRKIAPIGEGKPSSFKVPALKPIVPPDLEPVLRDSGWIYNGKGESGMHEFREPGTNIKLELLDRDLNPSFVKRKIAEKERQYGMPQGKPKVPKEGTEEPPL